MISISKECSKLEDHFFLLYFDNIKYVGDTGEIKFKRSENNPKCILTKKAKTKDGKERLIKVFKYTGDIKGKPKFEFSFDKNDFNFSFEKIKETFIFFFVLFKKKGIFDSRVEQNKIELYEKMNYFLEALNQIKETDKLDTLYSDSISIYSKKKSYHFLINIFVNVYNTKYCSLLLEKFLENSNEEIQKDKIIEESLEQYKYNFEDILQNAENVISSFNLNKIDFNGLILSYLNNYIFDKFNRKFDELYKNDKNTLFEILLKYRVYFKRQLNLEKEILDEIIQFASQKDFQDFKNNALFYLQGINTLLTIVEKNKEKIIKIKNFEPIEIGQMEDKEKFDFESTIKKMESIFKFSKDEKILLVQLKGDFWESLAKRCDEPNLENIKISYKLREEALKYKNLVSDLIKDKNNNIIIRDINSFMNKLTYENQLDINIKNYIRNNPDITNLEIIDIIKNYALFYYDEKFKIKRDPDILNKIDIEKIDEDFCQKFEDMEFEEIFKDDLNNYLLVFLNKIQKITDFDKIIKLINLKKLGHFKSMYLKALKTKYKNIIKEFGLSEEKSTYIVCVAKLAYFFCISEKKLDFLENNLKDSNAIDKKWKHKIYIILINICKLEEIDENDSKEEKELKKEIKISIIKFLTNLYSRSLESSNLNEFIELAANLEHDDCNDLIEYLDDKYIIKEKEFYSSLNTLNIKLLNLIKQKLILKNENQYIEKNTSVLRNIYQKAIEEREIKYNDLYSFFQVQKNIILEKLNILFFIQEKKININDIYDKLKRYFDEMKGTIENLTKYKNLLELYHNESKKNEISQFDLYITTLKKGTYQSFYEKKFEISTLLDENKSIVEKVSNIGNSKLFQIFYRKKYTKESLKKKSQFELAYEKFTEFKELIAEKAVNLNNNELTQNEIFKEIIEKHYDDEQLIKEINSLIYGARKNEEEFIIILNSKKYEKDLKIIFNFTEYFQKIKSEISELKIKCKDFFSKEKNIQSMKNVLKNLKEKEIYNYLEEANNNKRSNYMKMFHFFDNKSQALDFLYNHKIEDIKHLYDKIDPNNRTISMKDISDTLNCVGIFQELKEKNDLKEMIEYLKPKMEDNDALQWFKNYSDIYRSIIELNQNFDFSLSIYEQVDDIIKDATFIFNKIDDEFKYKKSGKKETISIEKIRELNNKIQIKQERNISPKNENSESFVEKYKKSLFFKNLSTNIEEIYDIMDTLRTKGSTLPILIIVEIEYPKIEYFLCENKRGKSEKKDFKDIYQFLTNAKRNIIKKLDSVYKQMTTIRLLYGKEIDSFLRHIEEEEDNNQFDSFLRYILNLTDCEKKVIPAEKARDRKVLGYISEYNRYNDDSFEIIQKYIVNLFRVNGKSIDRHYKDNCIEKWNNLRGIYKYLSDSDSMEEDILQIFLDTLGKMPIAQNILIYNKETTIEEMQAFFHRAILCKYNNLFVVEVNNTFSSDQQRHMNIFINNLLTIKNGEFNENNEKKQVDKSDTSSYMESCLVFIYNKENEFFSNELKHLKPKDLLLISNKHGMKRTLTSDNLSTYSSVKDSFRENLSRKTHIIRSEICGLGKSTKIKNEIKGKNQQYFYFPVGGNITKKKIYNGLENIIKKIKKIPDTNNYNDIAIHLDLFETKEYSVLNEFLFSFLITKFYSNNENIIYIPTNIDIYVEIPNCFSDFMNNNKILKFFQKDKDLIKLEKIPELDLPKDKIHLLKNMIELDTNEKIFEWLKYNFKENIKMKRYSYHQINIFINLFIGQYNKFGGHKLIFYELKKEGKKEIKKDVTKDCIDDFSKGTKYFIYEGFSKLLLDEKPNIKNNNDEIDLLAYGYEKKNDLYNLTFEDKLIFINKDKLEFNVLNISEEALKNGEALEMSEGEKNKEKEKRKKREKMYNSEQLQIIDFLYILKKILNLKNPVEPYYNEKSKKIEESGELKSLYEILGNNYVITIDNFRKMILIIYRIVANIPVILMGETGCGKTALIQKLNQLLNNGKLNMKSLVLDSSYNEEKLIKIMNKTNEEARNIYGEYWVFFDELNTCDSLSLITEIFINRSYKGIKLENNIRLIGACNPYKKKKKGVKTCGLTYQNNDNELVYLVNILPQSLMYYVFNFGSLDPEHEKQYISSILSDTIKDPDLKEKTKNIISECHQYLRKTYDDSVVSLRELARFKKMYNFFIDYYKKKKKVLGKGGSLESSKLKSIILSIYLCYYIRLVGGDLRTKFDNHFKKYFKMLVNYKFDKKEKGENFKENDVIYEGDLKKDLEENYSKSVFNSFNFSDILLEEENFILEEINPEKGIGRNQSLNENIFLLFTALNTNIPLIIIGKPGSSKSLSAQLICREMNGKFSKSEFFRLYPSIIQNYFQGSDSTTPEDVEGIFKIAKGRLNALKEKDETNESKDTPISMILFDELGLAERSKKNPLKALHGNLEYDGKEKGISFVGISNWTLDAAKINRALTLSVIDLDDKFEYVKYTSKSIAESINPEFGNRLIFDKILPNIYFNYKDNLKVLKILTVYKKYELQKYKSLLYKYREDKDFAKIFSIVPFFPAPVFRVRDR